MDEFENQPQQPESAQDANGTSRRNFLKVAVVSSAAAAAAVGGAGVAAATLSSRAPTGLSKLLVLDSTLVSTKNACFTFTQAPYADNTSTNKFNDTEDLFLWVWFTGLTADTYTLSLASPSAMPSYLTFNGTPVRVFANLTGCPSAALTISPFATGTGFPTTFAVTTQTSVLVQFQMHAKDAPSGTTLTMTVELKGTSYDHTATATAFFV